MYTVYRVLVGQCEESSVQYINLTIQLYSEGSFTFYSLYHRVSRKCYQPCICIFCTKCAVLLRQIKMKYDVSPASDAKLVSPHV